MNTTTPVLAQTTQERYFFRTADKLRLEGCANAVAQEAQNLTLFCEDEPLLDHYLQILLTHLKDNYPQHRVEIYFPTSPENLIQRFNEALASQKVADALRQADAGGQAQILVIHDPQVIAEHEMQLLGRLIQSLPGANIRLVLLLTSQGSQGFELASLKRRMLRWDIDTPTPEQALSALEFSDQTGQLLHLRRFLARICAGDPNTASALTALRLPPPEQGVESILRRTDSDGDNLVQLGPPPSGNAKFKLPALTMKKAQLIKMGTLGFGALVLSTALTMWLQPKSFSISKPGPVPAASQAKASERQEIFEYPLQANTKPNAVSDQGARPSPMAKFLIQPDQQSPLGASSKADLSKPAGTAVPLTAPSKVPELSKPDVGQVSSKSSVASAPTGSSRPQKLTNQTERYSDHEAAARWFRTLPGQSFIIWHAIAPTLEAAQNLRNSYAALNTSVILATNKGLASNPQFAIVSEPFESAGQAYAALKNAGYPPNNWVRSVKDVQQDLKPVGTDRRN